jgi:sterol 14-demethylase
MVLSVLTSHWFLTTLVLAATAIYLYIEDFGKKNLPPRFNYFLAMISGKYQMEEKGLVEFVGAGMKQCGPVFRIKVAHQGITIFVGPEGNKFFYNTSDKLLTAREAYKFTVPVFGPGVVYDSTLANMNRQLSFLRHALNGKAMQKYVDKVLMECDLYFKSWPEKGEINWHKEFSQLIINTASRCLMGDEVRETLKDDVAEQYEYLNDGMTRLSILFPYAPHPKHTLRDKARQNMIELFRPIIDSRRERKAKGEEVPQDFLQELIECRYENRREMTVEEIVGLLIACLFAGQHTSNISATWVAVLIGNNRWILPKLLAEQKAILGPDFKDGDYLEYEAVQQMNLLHMCMKEALRLFPPIVAMARTVQEDLQYDGFMVPKGDIVMSCPSVSHRLPECFKNPNEFQPHRFLAPRSEGEDVLDEKQWKFIAFGEGKHQCLGRDFAFLQVKTIFSYLFRHFDWEMINPVETKNMSSNYQTLVAGVGPDCNVRFVRKNLLKDYPLTEADMENIYKE